MERIYIVEDQMIITLDLQHMLEDLGYEVCGISPSYHETLNNIEVVKPDLILLDIFLQGDKTGIDLAHVLNQNYHIPFIFLTSHTDDQTVKIAKETQPRGYLVKPFKLNELYAAIEMAFGRT
ncbi:response regulator [Parapedobacter tibetensis]|uniref:response regulator n=1 Tax=Parapedobacter tibetensis TaxID=2972951 RepID=UPI00214D817D|nr:response regulator [Parapedobacter tibetensis]